MLSEGLEDEDFYGPGMRLVLKETDCTKELGMESKKLKSTSWKKYPKFGPMT